MEVDTETRLPIEEPLEDDHDLIGYDTDGDGASNNWAEDLLTTNHQDIAAEHDEDYGVSTKRSNAQEDTISSTAVEIITDEMPLAGTGDTSGDGHVIEGEADFETTLADNENEIVSLDPPTGVDDNILLDTGNENIQTDAQGQSYDDAEREEEEVEVLESSTVEGNPVEQFAQEEITWDQDDDETSHLEVKPISENIVDEAWVDRDGDERIIEKENTEDEPIDISTIQDGTTEDAQDAQDAQEHMSNAHEAAEEEHESPEAVDDIPAIKVQYKGEEFPFLSYSNDGFFSDPSILDAGMEHLLQQLRRELETEIVSEDELVFQIDELGLEFSESSIQGSTSTLTLRQILEIFDLLTKNQDPDSSRTLFTYIFCRPIASKRYEALVECATSGKGLDEIIHLFPSQNTLNHIDRNDYESMEDFSGGDGAPSEHEDPTTDIQEQVPETYNISDNVNATVLDEEHVDNIDPDISYEVLSHNDATFEESEGGPAITTAPVIPTPPSIERHFDEVNDEDDVGDGLDEDDEAEAVSVLNTSIGQSPDTMQDEGAVSTEIAKSLVDTVDSTEIQLAPTPDDSHENGEIDWQADGDVHEAELHREESPSAGKRLRTNDDDQEQESGQVPKRRRP